MSLTDAIQATPDQVREALEDAKRHYDAALTGLMAGVKEQKVLLRKELVNKRRKLRKLLDALEAENGQAAETAPPDLPVEAEAGDAEAD